MSRAAPLALALFVVCTTAVTAQDLSVAAGAVHARYADSITGTAASLSARWRGSSSSVSGLAEGGVSQFVTGEWAAHFAAYGAGMLLGSERAALGVAGGGDVNAVEGGAWSATTAVGPVLSATIGPVFATLGASLGGVRRVDASSFTLAALTLRTQTTLGDVVALESGFSGVVADSVRYADLTLGVTLRAARLQVGLSGGARAGDLADDPWGHVSAEYTLGPIASLEGALGRYPQDVSGFTDGLFGALGVRLRLTRDARARFAPRPAPALTVERVGDGRVRVTVMHPAAERLELAGEWNGWSPVPMMSLGGDRWTVELTLPPGIYQFALVADGASWTVPDGVATISDDFGGRVALLVVR